MPAGGMSPFTSACMITPSRQRMLQLITRKQGRNGVTKTHVTHQRALHRVRSIQRGGIAVAKQPMHMQSCEAEVRMQRASYRAQVAGIV